MLQRIKNNLDLWLLPLIFAAIVVIFGLLCFCETAFKWNVPNTAQYAYVDLIDPPLGIEIMLDPPHLEQEPGFGDQA